MTVLEAYRRVAYLQTLLGEVNYPESERIDIAIKKLKKHIPIKTTVKRVNDELLSNGIIHLEDNSTIHEWIEHGLLLWEIHINRQIKKHNIF